MEDELRKIDLIRERTRLGYQEARELLNEAGGDVVSALILWERRGGRAGPSGAGGEVVEKVRDWVRQGNRTWVRVYRGDQTYLQVPATIGVLGAVLAPYLAIAGAAACLVTGCRVSLEPAGQEPSEGGSAAGRPVQGPAGQGL